jgi:hypothetical protein
VLEEKRRVLYIWAQVHPMCHDWNDESVDLIKELLKNELMM